MNDINYQTQYYLRSKSHPLSLIIGEKVLSPKVVKSLNKNTIDIWASEQLKSTVDIYSQTNFQQKSVDSFLSDISGYRTTLSYNNQYESLLLQTKELIHIDTIHYLYYCHNSLVEKANRFLLEDILKKLSLQT